MDNYIVGTILEIHPEEEITPKLKKKTFVVKTEERYPQELLLETINNQISILSDFKVGDEVKVSINVKGRRYTPKNSNKDKFFVSLGAWKVEKQPTIPEDVETTATPPQDTFEDDLPF